MGGGAAVMLDQVPTSVLEAVEDDVTTRASLFVWPGGVRARKENDSCFLRDYYY